MTVHLNGMGLVGCFLALKFEELGIDFTWWDRACRNPCEIPPVPTAWEACTGCAYPSGEPQEWKNYIEILQPFLLKNYGEKVPFWKRFCALANYGYMSKGVPHSGHLNKKLAPQEGKYFQEKVSILNWPSIHINAQKLVPAVRERFQSRFQYRGDSEQTNRGIFINSHGFSKAPGLERGYVWGWHALVPLSFQYTTKEAGYGFRFHDECELGEFEFSEEIALNAQESRYVYLYSYPCPGTRFNYIGTSMIYQKTPNKLETANKIEKCIEKFRKNFPEDVLKIGPVQSFTQGWRPISNLYPGEKQVRVKTVRGVSVIEIASQGANGWRSHPAYVKDVVDCLRTLL